MKKILPFGGLLVSAALIFLNQSVKGQINYKDFIVGFETGIPSGWTQSPYSSSTYSWQTYSGGVSPVTPPQEYSKHPRRAHTGTYNALFQVQSLNNEAQKLITPKITGLKTYGVYPALKFWHAQGKRVIDNFSGTDQLRVYFKNHIDSAWSLLQTYIDPTVVYFPNSTLVDSTYWVEREIMLPVSRLTDGCYFAFEGTTKWGYGVCLDDMKIVDTGTATKKFKSSSVSQPVTTAVPIGSTYNPIIRVALNVTGNVGSVLLKALSVKSQNISNADIATNGVKLYYTVDSTFSPTTQLGRSRTFTSDTIIFSNLSKELPKGTSYVWVTYDISSGATSGNTIDASIPANGINVNDSIFPTAEVSPIGSRKIFETIFSDNFESDYGWGFSGEFERAFYQTTGKGGSTGNPDPSLSNSVSGSYLIGTDITGKGSNSGDYENKLSSGAYLATSPTINLKYYKSIRFTFYRWLNIEQSDNCTIDYSTDDGASWSNLWTNGGSVIAESLWGQQVFDLPTKMERQPLFKLRFTLGPTDAQTVYSGWNIDDVVLTGEHILKDVGVTEWLSMNDDCNLSSTANLTVRIKNYADATTPSSFPVAVSIDGGSTWTVDTVKTAIAKDGTYDFTFNKVAAISMATPDIYKVKVRTLLPGDQDETNDALSRTVYSFPTYTVPYATNFDDSKSLWKSEGKTEEWQWGTPESSPIPYTSPNVWVTQLSGTYYVNDSSWVISPCFNFSGIDKPIVDLRLWNEVNKDSAGVVLQYTTNNSTWQDVPRHGYSQWDWNWYNNSSVKALNGPGWDTTTIDWMRARQFLPSAIANQSSVRFRMKFASNNYEYTAKGAAFDNFRVYNAPFDYGVDTIANLTKITCQGDNPSLLKVKVTNYGIRDMAATDTLIIGVKVNNQAAVIDTFQLGTALTVGTQKEFTLHKPIDIAASGYYLIKAYAHERDANFYGGNNDTTWSAIWVKNNPASNLKDTIRALDIDTVVIHAVDSTNFQYQWYFNNSSLSGATVSSLSAKPYGEGKYKVSITNSTTGCHSIDSVVVKVRKSDIKIHSIVAPVNYCGYSNNFKPIISVVNMGPDTLQIGRIVTFNVKLDALAEQIVSYTLTKNLPNGDTTQWELNAPLPTMATGNHSLKIFLTLIGDKNASNDTIKSTFEIYGYPTVNLGADREVQDLKYQFDAGAGFDSYKWSVADSISRTLTVSKTGFYSVIVANSHGCTDEDTVYIRLRIHDLIVKRILQPVSSCTFPTSTNVMARFTNAGSDTILTGTIVAVKYLINGTLTESTNLTLNKALLPNDSIDYTFTTPVDFSAVGSRKLSLSAVMPDDMRPTNDTLSATVHTFGNPTVNLGPDQTLKALQYSIKAGPGFVSYQWQDGSTDSTYTVTQSHVESSNIYSVKVTDGNGCQASDAVNVVLQIQDVSLASVVMDDSICITNEPKYLKVKVQNSGNTNLAGINLSIRYQINGGTQESQTFTYSANAGTNIDSIQMTNEMAFDTVGVPKTVKVSVSIYNSEDLRLINDTLTRFIKIKRGPKVVFADEVNDTIMADYPYTLDATVGTNNTYLWSTYATTSSIDISSNGHYAVKVTSTNGCEANNEVNVIEKVYDVDIVGFSLASACELPSQQKFAIVLKNTGTMPLSNAPLTLRYSVNSASGSQQYNATSVLNQKDSVYYYDAVDLSSAGNYTFNLKVDATTNNRYADDTTIIISNWGYPVINMADTVRATSWPVVLDPGAFASYLWLPGQETSPTLNVNSQGLYSVEVDNGYECKSTKTVYVVDATPVDVASGSGTIAMYPNPASSNTAIDFDIPGNDQISVDIISTSGAVVLHKEITLSGRTKLEIPEIQALSKGIYQVAIKGKSWTVTKKLVIN
jgi:hypothetical protein